MRSVWKFPLNAHEITVLMPTGAEPCHFGYDPQGVLCVWAVVDTDVLTKEPMEFRIHGTGHAFGDGEEFVGTVLTGPFMSHLFRVKP